MGNNALVPYRHQPDDCLLDELGYTFLGERCIGATEVMDTFKLRYNSEAWVGLFTTFPSKKTLEKLVVRGGYLFPGPPFVMSFNEVAILVEQNTGFVVQNYPAHCRRTHTRPIGWIPLVLNSRTELNKSRKLLRLPEYMWCQMLLSLFRGKAFTGTVEMLSEE